MSYCLLEESERDHYMFLHAALAKCERCLAFWLHHGADLNRGAANHPDWIALEWARASNASPEIMRLLAPSVWPSLRPRGFCAGVELDMYVHVPGRICRREVRQMSPRARSHHLFLHAAGSLCKNACKLGWIEELTHLMAPPGEPLKSAFTWAEEAGSGGRGSAFNAECSRENGARSICHLLVISRFQRWRLSAGTLFPFSDFWSLGADDRCAAVASAALRGNLEMLKDICDSDDCSIFIRPGVGVEEANLPDVFEHWTLREYVCLHFYAPPQVQSAPELALVLLWIDGQESMEAFDFAVSPVEEPELEVLRTLTLTGKVFQVFSLQEWKSQLRLIAGCYKEHKNLVSELLRVGASR